MTDDLHFEEADHVYSVGGRVLPSVTQLLKPIAIDFSRVMPDVLERKRAIGQAVHLACSLDDEGDLEEESLADELRGYLAAWRKFRNGSVRRIIMNEQRMHHGALFYAGTVDRVLEIDALPGEWTIDIKTAALPHPIYGVQTMGYSMLAGGPSPRMRRATIHLRPDGEFKIHEYKNPNDEVAFRACLSLHHWSQSNS